MLLGAARIQHREMQHTMPSASQDPVMDRSDVQALENRSGTDSDRMDTDDR